MKNLLFVMTTLYNGGAERSLVNLLNEIPKGKYNIDVLLFKRRGMFLAQVPQEYTVLETPKELKRMYGSLKDAGLLLPWRLLGNVLARISTKNICDMRGFRWKYFYGPAIKKFDKKYDVALAYISEEVLSYVNEKVDADKKYVWIHNDYRKIGHSKKYDYKHLKNMDGIVSISEECVDILKEEFPEFANKTYMIENITSSVTLEKQAQEFYPSEYDKDIFTILSIGRFHEQKGFDMAIKAAHIIKQQNLKFKWFVLGGGELEAEYKALIKEQDVEDCFILLGTRENPYAYIKNCDLFVQSSRYEGKSVVMDETKILKKPIVVTNYPTVKDQVINGKEGMIVDMSPEGIASGVIEMIRNDDLRKQYVDYLSSHEYGNQSEIEKYLELIDKGYIDD